MLVFTRKPQQSFRIGRDIVVTVIRIRDNRVSIGIEAPDDVTVVRSEIDRGDQPNEEKS